MKLWPVALFLLTFGIEEHTKHCSMSFPYSSTRNDMLQCFVYSPIPKVSEKKEATGQSFIRKEITTCRIGTLVLVTLRYLMQWKRNCQNHVCCIVNVHCTDRFGFCLLDECPDHNEVLWSPLISLVFEFFFNFF